MEPLAWAGVALFAGASFVFALAESALFSLGKWRVKELAETAPQAGPKVAKLLQEPHSLLGTIVLGNTFANAGFIATSFWLGTQNQWPSGLMICAVFIAILFGCEVLPKTLAVRASEKWSLRLAQPILFFQTFSRPLREVAQKLNALILRAAVPASLAPLPAMTDEEYHELLEMAEQQGTLRSSEKEIILQIVRLDRRTVKEVMKPRSQLACIPDDLSLEEMAEAARRFKHRRLPMYDETPDTIVGILNTRTFLLDPDRDLDAAIEFPSFVPETMNLLQLLKSFQRQRRGLAIVLDEFGGTAGLVTMEDILEEVVGQLHRKKGTGFLFEKLGEGEWRVNGTTRLEEFRLEYTELPDVPGVETIAGALVHHLGYVPSQGQSVNLGPLRLTAKIVDERRVHEVLVEARRKGSK